MQYNIKSTIDLTDGNKLPVFGLGTWMSPPNEVKKAVTCAIKEHGYIHIDAARVYKNEAEVGDALKELFKGGFKREEIFLTSKLWNTFQRPEHQMDSIKKSLTDLKLDYIDLYLVHWPVAYQYSGKEELFPKEEDGKYKFDNDLDLREVWKGMEAIKKAGLAKSIGISNFNEKQIEYILETAVEKPVVNQIEVSPEFPNTKLIEFCKLKNIVVTAYSPLGNPGSPFNDNYVKILDREFIKEIAKKYNKTPAQVCIRFALDQGITVIPKSVTATRIKENADVFDFKLSKEDIEKIIRNSPQRRTCAGLDLFGESKEYPFEK